MGKSPVIKITVLVENTAGSDKLGAEHGIAYYIETSETRGLFDTGASDLILRNAAALGIDLAQLDWIALSHGHHDHAGGLFPVLRQSKSRPEIYAHPEGFRRIGYNQGFTGDSPGGDTARGSLDAPEWITAKANPDFSSRPTEITGGLLLTGEVPRVVDFEEANPEFTRVVEGREVIDIIPDDMSLIIQVPSGTVVLFGCAHSGPVNILEYTRKITGATSFIFAGGGTHLGDVSDERLSKTVRAFRRLGVKKVSPVHCSGKHAFDVFREEYGGDALPMPSGTVLEF